MDCEAEFKTLKQKQNKQSKRIDKTPEIQGINVDKTMMDNLYKFPQQTLYLVCLKQHVIEKFSILKDYVMGALHPLDMKGLGDNTQFAQSHVGFPGGTSSKESTCQSRRLKRLRFIPWFGKTPWRKKWQLTPLFLPGEELGRLQIKVAKSRT